MFYGIRGYTQIFVNECLVYTQVSFHSIGSFILFFKPHSMTVFTNQLHS